MNAAYIPTLALRVQAIDLVANGTRMFTLQAAEGTALPAFTAGSHIELQLAPGLARSYSLLNSPEETGQYQIAVHLSPTSKGGSTYLHSSIAVGQTIQCSAPRNLFELNESAAHTCLIGGGIGITPLMSMAKRLTLLKKSWELHYCARTPDHAGWMQDLTDLAQASGNKVFFHFDQIPDGAPLNIAELVRKSQHSTHFYCCGPSGMLKAFEEATAQCPERRHVEYFTAKSDASLEGGFELELARSGKCLLVPPGRSILEIVTEAGLDIPTSCREGICGSCETRILSGEADHRDAVLTLQEQAENKSMMICCSGARSARLVLDL